MTNKILGYTCAVQLCIETCTDACHETCEKNTTYIHLKYYDINPVYLESIYGLYTVNKAVSTLHIYTVNKAHSIHIYNGQLKKLKHVHLYCCNKGCLVLTKMVAKKVFGVRAIWDSIPYECQIFSFSSSFFFFFLPTFHLSLFFHNF